MGQIQNVGKPGITVTPIDRETGPGAGPGTSGNRDIFLGANSGANSTLDDSIVLGNNAGSGGTTGAKQNGLIVIGSGAAPALIGANNSNTANSGDIIIGYQAALAQIYGGGNVVVGNQALQATTGSAGAASIQNVIIGQYAAQNGASLTNASVIIGYAAGRGTSFSTPNTGLASCVVIGWGALSGNSATNMSGVICIGAQAGTSMGQGGTNCSNALLIGTGCAQSAADVTDCVFLGSGIQTSSAPIGNVAVGSSIFSGSENFNTCIGSNIGFANGGGQPHRGNIIIGYRAGGAESNGANYKFVLETWDQNNVRRAMFAGDMSTGNIVIGNSAVAQRDQDTTGGLQNLKLCDGAAGVGNPNGGGYFYSLLGELHWVGSAGTDTIIAPP